MTLLTCFIKHFMSECKLNDGKFCEKLAAIGVHTVEDLQNKCNTTDAIERSTVSSADLVKVQKCVYETFSKSPMKLTQAVSSFIKSQIILKTGCQSLDDLLPGGGIQSGHVTQVSGPESSGKTQFCLNLAAEAIKLGKEVLYIDTQSAFSPTRLVDLIAKKGLASHLIHSVKVATIFTIHDLFDLLTLLLEENEYSLLVLDSLPALFNPICVELEREGKKFLAFEFLSELTQILAAFRLAHPGLVIVVTNYTDKWYQRFWPLTCSLDINLSISFIDPPTIVYSAKIKPKNQFESQQKCCSFLITDSGLVQEDVSSQLTSSYPTQTFDQKTISQSSVSSQASLVCASQGLVTNGSISSQLITADHDVQEVEVIEISDDEQLSTNGDCM